MEDLTIRWTKGEPLDRQVIHPPPTALGNAPFLRNPTIVSVTVGRDRFGPNLTIRLDKAAGAVLAAETEKHHRDQMLIMLGGRILVAAIIMGRLHDSIVLDGFPAETLPSLADRLRTRSDDASCPQA